MAERTCDVDGCDKAHRARGLCSGHYNVQYQPNRHRKIAVQCAQCGVVVEKHASGKYNARFCSLRCRDVYWKPGRPSCKVYFNTCLSCEAWFACRNADHFCCTAICRRRLDVATAPPRPSVSVAEWRDAKCAWCGEQYGTNQPAQAYCSKPCRARAGRLRRRAAESRAYGTYSWTDFMRIAQRFAYRCAYCAIKPDVLDPDHVVPLSRGGPNTTANLLPACRTCNCDKRDLLLSEWDLDRLRRGLAPRLTSWPAEDRRFWHLSSVLANTA